MSNPHELKALQVRKTKLESQIKFLEGERDHAALGIASKKKELTELNKKIDAIASSEPIVTEHAMLRYIERAMGIDLTEIQARILNAQNRKIIEFSGSCKIKADGIELVVKDRRVVSVV